MLTYFIKKLKFSLEIYFFSLIKKTTRKNISVLLRKQVKRSSFPLTHPIGHLIFKQVVHREYCQDIRLTLCPPLYSHITPKEHKLKEK